MPTDFPTSTNEYKSVATHAEIRDIEPTVHRAQVLALGSGSAGDGGGGLYVFDATSTATDNSGSVLQPGTTSQGRWELQHCNGVVVTGITGAFALKPFTGILRCTGTFGQQVALTLPKASQAPSSGFLTVASEAALTASVTASSGDTVYAFSRSTLGVSGSSTFRSDFDKGWYLIDRIVGSG